MNRDELIESLAATAVNMYRAAMVAGSGEFAKQLRADLQDPKPGDLVINLAEWDAPAGRSIGQLEHVFMAGSRARTTLVRLLDGSYETWRNALLVKIPARPFSMTTTIQETP